MPSINVYKGDSHSIIVVVKDQDGGRVDLSSVPASNQHLYIKADITSSTVIKDITGTYTNTGADGLVKFNITPSDYTGGFDIGTYSYGVVVTPDGSNTYTVAIDAIEVEQGIQ